jgi:cytochrome c
MVQSLSLATVPRITFAVLSLACALLTPVPGPSWAAGDAAAGGRLYHARCRGCHGDEHAAPTLGPTLVGIIGRKAGTGETGVHSREMIESGIVWDVASLRRFLAAPTKEVPGTLMLGGVDNPQELDDVVAYLGSLR